MVELDAARGWLWIYALTDLARTITGNVSSGYRNSKLQHDTRRTQRVRLIQTAARRHGAAVEEEALRKENEPYRVQGHMLLLCEDLVAILQLHTFTHSG